MTLKDLIDVVGEDVTLNIIVDGERVCFSSKWDRNNGITWYDTEQIFQYSEYKVLEINPVTDDWDLDLDVVVEKR